MERRSQGKEKINHKYLIQDKIEEEERKGNLVKFNVEPKGLLSKQYKTLKTLPFCMNVSTKSKRAKNKRAKQNLRKKEGRRG